MDKDKEQVIKMLVFGIVLVFFAFILPIFLYSQNPNINFGLNVFNQNTEDTEVNKVQDTDEKETKNEDKNTETKEEIPKSTEVAQIQQTDIPRNAKDPFYSQIYTHMEQLKREPEIQFSYNYYPKDNYIVNAASSDGQLRLFKKKPILIYVPKNEYYDAITQAFVTYNYMFKGLLHFRATSNPDKSDIKIVFTKDLSKYTDNPKAVGAGSPLKYDSKGNIKYSELYIRTTSNFGEKTGMIEVYNVLLHEIGHCIGIAGHSPIQGDIMYKQESPNDKIKLANFSSRDIETLKLMYSGRNDLISNSLRNVKKEKLEENLLYAQEHSNSDSYLNLANSYYSMGQYDKALEAYRAAMKLNPQNATIYINLGNCYIKAKKYDDAELYLRYALKYAKTDEEKTKASVNISYVYDEKEDYEKALRYAHEAIKLDKNNERWFFNYLEICVRADKKEQAIEAYDKYISNYNEADFNENDKKYINWVNENREKAEN